MTKRKRKRRERAKWAEVISAIGVVIGIILGLFTIGLSVINYLNSKRAIASVAVIIAQSPRLASELDTIRFESLRLSPHIVHTPYLLEQEIEYDEALERGYLFALLINYGPAMIQSISTSPFTCNPVEGLDPPEGIDSFGELGPAEDGTAYAILLDVLEPIHPQLQWTPANYAQGPVRCQYISFDAFFRDQLGRTQDLRFAIGQAPPGVQLIPTAGGPYILPE